MSSIEPTNFSPLTPPPTGFNSLPTNPSPLADQILKQSMQPPLGKRFKEEAALTSVERAFIEKFETRNVDFTNELAELLGPVFEKIAKDLDQDGVAILPEYFTGEALKGIQEFFAEQIEKKPIRPFLEQASFNGGVDAKEALQGSKEMSEALSDPLFFLLASHHLGNPAAIANWRGYRLEPRESLLYRAWSWHQDQKRSEIKIMILLNDVAEYGQAMQVIKGSHKKWWNMDSQRDTKYTLEEVLKLGNDPENQQITKCYGRAGSVVIFNTNALHSGYRNLSARRDVITVNFLANIPGMPMFTPPKLHPDVAEKNRGSFLADATRMTEGTKPLDALTEKMVDDLTNDVGLQERIQDRLSSLKVSEQDVPASEIQKIYAHIPSFSEARPRFRGDNFDAFKTFLVNHVLDDFGPDLDLVIRLGDKDVKRDAALARLRDARADDPINRALQDFSLLSLNDIKNQPNINLKELSDNAVNLEKQMKDYKKTLEYKHELNPNPQTEKDIKTLEESIEFCLDLSEAFTRTDSCERLRTNLIFLRALYFQHANLTFEPRFVDDQIPLMKLQAYVTFNDDFRHSQPKA